MAKIVFINGDKLQVPQQVLEVMHERVVNQTGGAKQWQGFTVDGKITYLINMDEICYIES
jgi:hypothetical protein